MTPLIPLRVAVLTISDTRTLANDTSGLAAEQALTNAGHTMQGRSIVTDDVLAIRRVVTEHIERPLDALITTGGTGITARDVTPEAIAPLITRHIPGFGELFRMLSYAEIGSSTIQSRAFAAVCGHTLVFALPGSTAAVTLAMRDIVVPQLDARHKPCNFATLLPRIRRA